MVIKPEIALRDIITVIGFVVTIVTILLTYKQIKVSVKTAKGTFIKDIMDRFTTDEGIRKVFYLIEYDEFKYPDNNFHGSEIEKEIDSLLYFLDTIGALVKLDLISLSDVEIMHYEIKRVYSNQEIKKYFEFLDSWYEKNQLSERPFSNFRWLAENMLKNRSLTAGVEQKG